MAISLNELFEKLVVCWMVPPEIVVKDDGRIKIAGIFERAVALDEKLTLELTL